MSVSFRKFHRFASPWIFAFLLVSLVTGISYRIGRAWFGMGKATGELLLSVHSGEWLGEGISFFYVLVAGAGLLALLGSGLVLLLKGRAGKGPRGFHRVWGAVLLLPLAATALTGILFKVGGEWFGFSQETQRLLMAIHEGRWLGNGVRPFYVLFVGLGLLALGLVGLRLRGRFERVS